MSRILSVYIEKNGKQEYVGKIVGDSSVEACFSYDDSYIEKNGKPISISLPLEEKAFDEKRTRYFFEGLLPEGFTRKCVADWMQKDVNDYLSILAGLGNECLGAIQILDENSEKIVPDYRKLTEREVEILAKEGASESAEIVTKSHLSLTGASGKVGLYYDKANSQWYLPLGSMPSTHIVKQSHVRLEKIVVNEQLCLLTASNLGIKVPNSFIINSQKMQGENILFATERYDRKFKKENYMLKDLQIPFRLHQEDFAQAMGISSSMKYEKKGDHYLKKMFEVIRKCSSNPLEDQKKLWDICIFNYLIGNTDNHIKNVSLLYAENLNDIRLAPAYDMVSTMIYESSTENMSLGIGGIYDIRKITKESFEDEAVAIGLGKKFAMQRIDEMREGVQDALNEATESLAAEGFDSAEEVKERIMQRGGIHYL